MMARIVALVAAIGTAAVAAVAALWAKRKADEEAAREAEIIAAVEADTLASADVVTASPVATIPVDRVPDQELPDAAVPATADDLTTVKGIGAVSAERLSAAGVTSFAQLAAWSDADIEAYGARIKVSPQRIRREDWVGQARAITSA